MCVCMESSYYDSLTYWTLFVRANEEDVCYLSGYIDKEGKMFLCVLFVPNQKKKNCHTKTSDSSTMGWPIFDFFSLSFTVARILQNSWTNRQMINSNQHFHNIIFILLWSNKNTFHKQTTKQFLKYMTDLIITIIQKYKI